MVHCDAEFTIPRFQTYLVDSGVQLERIADP